MGNSELLTIAQAAAELGMQPDSVRRAIHQRRLKAVRLGPKATMITRAELARYAAADKQPGGRPRRAQLDS